MIGRGSPCESWEKVWVKVLTGALDDGEQLTRKDLEEVIGAPERQWHTQLEDLVAGEQVERVGAGKKGDPYRFQTLRKEAAQQSAQQPRSNSSFPAAHPKDAAETKRAAPSAENGTPALDPDALIALVNAGQITDTDAEREWSRLEQDGAA